MGRNQHPDVSSLELVSHPSPISPTPGLAPIYSLERRKTRFECRFRLKNIDVDQTKARMGISVPASVLTAVTLFFNLH